MAYPYGGLAADADWVNPPNIIADGELWQFGDPVTGAGGHFQATKSALDRIAWLKLHAGVVDATNTWTAKQIFNCDVDLTGAHTTNVKGGHTLDINSDGSLVGGTGATIEFNGEVKIDGLLNRTGASAVTKKRTQNLSGTGGGTVVATMGAADLLIFDPITGSNKTLSFDPPADNVPCVEYVLYGGAITSADSGMPDAWGGPSDHSLTINAGTASDTGSSGQRMVLFTVMYDGADFYIHSVSS